MSFSYNTWIFIFAAIGAIQTPFAIVGGIFAMLAYVRPRNMPATAGSVREGRRGSSHYLLLALFLAGLSSAGLLGIVIYASQGAIPGPQGAMGPRGELGPRGPQGSPGIAPPQLAVLQQEIIALQSQLQSTKNSVASIPEFSILDLQQLRANRYKLSEPTLRQLSSTYVTIVKCGIKYNTKGAVVSLPTTANCPSPQEYVDAYTDVTGQLLTEIKSLHMKIYFDPHAVVI